MACRMGKLIIFGLRPALYFVMSQCNPTVNIINLRGKVLPSEFDDHSAPFSRLLLACSMDPPSLR
jgi:hypothetical protein